MASVLLVFTHGRSMVNLEEVWDQIISSGGAALHGAVLLW